MKVSVHWNYHKKLLSVVPLEGRSKGLVVAHVEQIALQDAEFRVSEKGRRRVIKEQCKNVHAKIVGTPVSIWGADLRGDPDNDTLKGLGIGKVWPQVSRGTQVVYNPYLNKTFVRKGGKVPVLKAEQVWLDRNKVTAIGLS